MRTDRFVIAVLSLSAVFGVGFAAAVHLSATQRAPTDVERAAALISAFDGCIQGRFRDVDQSFGLRRIITPGATPHRFEPESTRELDVVQGLEAEGFQVVLYLTGRRVLRPKPQISRAEEDFMGAIIKGPVLITYGAGAAAAGAGKAAPRAMDLWDDSRRAMIAFAKTDSVDFARADWNFLARPVRASDAMCLQCHHEPVPGVDPARGIEVNALKIGDPMGVVIYGFRKTP
jgi:hypothetical protein